MFLGASNWYSLVMAEISGASPSANTYNAARSGIVIDTLSKNVFLYVTKDKTMFEGFRNAIQAHLGIFDGNGQNIRYKGLFLDGSYSSQMKAKKADGANTVVYVDWKSEGQERQLTQIIALRNHS